VLIPTLTGAGAVLAQPKLSSTSVGDTAALAASAITKLWLCPAGISTGAFGLPVVALVLGSVV
jgi:hypothetical protein